MRPERTRKTRTKHKRLFVQERDEHQKRNFLLGSTERFAAQPATNLANIRSCPTGVVHYEPMFVQKEKKNSRAAARAADALDLMIEFVTLGEYGLEYPEHVHGDSRRNTTHDQLMSAHQPSQQRHGTQPQRHRHGRRPCRPGRTRVDLPGFADRPGHEVPGVQPGRRHRAQGKSQNRPTSALPEALRPPRIRIEAA